MLRRFAPTVAILAAVAVTAGCGGGPSEEEYAAEVDAVCTDAYEFLQELPRRAAEEDLETDAIQDLADEKAEDSEAAITALEPPDDLADAHERLLALGTEEPPFDTLDPEAVVAYFGEFRDVYAEIGAEECVAIQEDSIERFEDASSAGESVEVGPGDPEP